MSTASRVFKNTWYLYAKMALTVFISLYSTRLILASLGEIDFGIFNVIGGSIALLGFINSTMANATQRFMSYAEGEGIVENQKRIFNISFVLHIAIAVLTVVILLAFMPLLFDRILNIAPHRVFAAKVVYFSFVFSTALTITNVPYDATLNAHENMLYYSVIGVVESLLRLAIAFACVYAPTDKLILYGVLMAAIPVVTLTVMKVYCHKHYAECVVRPRQYWDWQIVKKIASFSGWNFLTAISSMGTVQGLSLVLNHFFGAALNAAQGIATQVNGQLSSFSTNMMKALNPVIVKKTAQGDQESLNAATFAGCKFSALLIMCFALPCMLEMPYILRIWLKQVPAWACMFCVLQLVYTIIAQSAATASTAVYGSGKIKWYAIWKSLMNILPIFVTSLCYWMGMNAAWQYIPMIVFMGVGGNVAIVYYAHRLCGLPIDGYMRQVVWPLIATTVIMLVCGIIPILTMPSDFVRLICTCCATSLGVLLSTLFVLLSPQEKDTVLRLLHLRK